MAYRVNMAKKFEVQKEFLGLLIICELHMKALCTGGSSVAVSSTAMHTTLACVVQTFPQLNSAHASVMQLAFLPRHPAPSVYGQSSAFHLSCTLILNFMWSRAKLQTFKNSIFLSLHRAFRRFTKYHTN